LAGKYPPDIVVIEFAVNDYSDETNGVCYESLCLMAYEGPGSPAVILMFSLFANDENLEDRLSKVGCHYKLPMVSVKEALLSQYDKKEQVISRRQYFRDIYHPGNAGHQIMADALDFLWQTASLKPPVKEAALPSMPVIGNDYRNFKTLTRANLKEHPAVISINPGGFKGRDVNLQNVESNDDVHTTPKFPDNWMYTEVGGPGFCLTINCQNLLLIFKDSGDNSFTAAEIYIDGIRTRIVDPLAGGWDHCHATFIINAEKSAEHRVEIKPLISGASIHFTILGFGYN
jgi:hypothetical protein